MKRFLFITHLTPVAKRSSLRQALYDLHLDALRNQTSKDWKVLQLGETDRNDGVFFEFRIEGNNREELFTSIQTVYRKKEVLALIDEADYIVKIDDDDIISPTVLSVAADLDFDCYYDSYHTFYDVTSGLMSQQHRPWFASTCIHRKECAFDSYLGDGASPLGNLLYSDHSKSWHKYYQNRRTICADSKHPVYLRVLSPTSITSSNSGRAPMTLGDISFEKYYAYLKSFGYWDSVSIQEFDDSVLRLNKVWELFSGKPQRPIPNVGLTDKVMDRISQIWKKK